MLRYLLKLSRPRFWLYLAGPVLVGVAYGADSVGDLVSPAAIALFAYFLVPANVYLYGVNDAFDVEADAVNPKKADGESEHDGESAPEVRYQGGTAVTAVVALCGLAGVALAVALATGALATGALAAADESAAASAGGVAVPGLGGPAIPGLDGSAIPGLGRVAVPGLDGFAAISALAETAANAETGAGAGVAAGAWVLAFLALGYAYSAPPFRLKTTPPLDSASNGLYVLPGAAAYVALAGAQPPALALAGGWLWSMAMHTFSAIPDVEPDRRAGIETTATHLGARGALAYCAACWLLAAGAFGLLDLRAGALLVLYPLLAVGVARTEVSASRAYWWFPAINAAVGAVLTLGGLWGVVGG